MCPFWQEKHYVSEITHFVLLSPFACCCSASLRSVTALMALGTAGANLRCVWEAPVFGQTWPCSTLSYKLCQSTQQQTQPFFTAPVLEMRMVGVFWQALDEWKPSQEGPDPHQGGPKCMALPSTCCPDLRSWSSIIVNNWAQPTFKPVLFFSSFFKPHTWSLVSWNIQ